MKPISMIDFALKEAGKCGIEPRLHRIENYAKILKQVIEFWMFVPCDENGILLEELTKPDWSDYNDKEGGNTELYQFNLKAYKKFLVAKNKVMFKNFKLMEGAACRNTVINDKGVRQYCGQIYTQNTIETLVGKDLEFTDHIIEKLMITP